ncbi:hypothetical protein [Marinomonas atlantica]|uniref:hypothetical protein n=1 Tax=Marinomonas atlantica TaxID=1806668 RepID=UPI00082FECE8|nr:hypothetical protein [Marinomonas atlantica]
MKSLWGVILLLVVTGCSSNVVLSGRQVSNVDPAAIITPESRIRVEAMSSGDSLTQKRYLPQVVQAFQANGFHYVGPLMSKPDFIARFELSSQMVTRDEKAPIYKDIRTGRSTHCYKNKDGEHYCDTDYHVMPYVVGYETIPYSVLEATFRLELVNQDNQVVLHSTSTVENKDCSRWKLYEFLVSNSLQRLDLSAPLDQPFRIEMPETYQCTDDQN